MFPCCKQMTINVSRTSTGLEFLDLQKPTMTFVAASNTELQLDGSTSLDIQVSALEPMVWCPFLQLRLHTPCMARPSDVHNAQQSDLNLRFQAHFRMPIREDFTTDRLMNPTPKFAQTTGVCRLLHHTRLANLLLRWQDRGSF